MLTVILERFWVMSLQACVLIFIVLIARALLKKYPKVYAYCLWGLVGLRLLCPVFIETSFSLQPDVQGFVENAVNDVSEPVNNVVNNQGGIGIKAPGQIIDSDNQSSVYEGMLEEIKNQTSGMTFTSPNVGEADGEAGVLLPDMDKEQQTLRPDNVAASDTGFSRDRIFEILSVVYLAGAGIVALVYIVQYIVIRQRIATAVRDRENIWLSENIYSPFVIGIIRPRIILPYGLSKEEEEHILKHERTHIRHHDPIIRLLGILCIILHWWNPLVWLAVHKMNQDMEMFCDEAALSKASATDRKAYANTLVSFSIKRSGFSVGLSFGESNTERRVKNIMKKRRNSLIIIGVLAVLALFCAVAFLTIPRDNEEGSGNEQETTTTTAADDATTTTEQPTTTDKKVTIEIETTDGTKETEDNKDNTIGGFYEAFLKNEISVPSPYDPNDRLTVMDDEKYETEFENAKKSYALVDIDGDERQELIFKMIGEYPSELMYILKSRDNELICYDVFETHTNKMAFGVYDYGFVWWGQNYDGNVREYYTYTAEGKRELVNRFTEGQEDKMAAYEGNEPEWHDWNVYEAPADKLLNKFLAGEINAEGLNKDSFNISDLDMSGESWDSYSIGNKVDLDNDGDRELIIYGPYGGMYLDASGDKVKVFETGDGTASNLSYTHSDNAVWIVHSDTMHAGRKVYKLDRYKGADKIAESVTLAMYYSEDSGYAPKTYYYNDIEISDAKYTELYQKFFGAVSIEDQIILIEQNMNMWKQSPDYANELYKYAVTDLDGNGRLEVIASNMGGTGSYTYSHIYEVNEQFNGLVECETNFVEGDSQPDIIETKVDAYYNWETKTYYYIEYDLVKVSPGEYHIVQSALSLKNGKVESNLLAREIQRYGEAEGEIEYYNSHGDRITEKAYVEMAYNTFNMYSDSYEAQFGWRDMAELNDANYKAIRTMLMDSYNLFGMVAVDRSEEVAAIRNRHSAYMNVLYSVAYNKEFPDGVDYGFTEGSDMSENNFAFYDVDNDGVEELILNYVTTFNAGMVKKIYDYNYVTAGVKEEFSAYPTTTIYNNGIIIAFASHNHGRAPMLETFWPYTLYWYNPTTDMYEDEAIVDAWDKTYKAEGFPTEVDKDGDGIVYCVMTEGKRDYKNAMDKADYDKWLNAYIGGAKEAEIPYMELSDVCISIADASADAYYREIVIDDDPNKSRDELALDIMEAIRAYHASLPEVAYGYFDELKIISLESYDESDSDPESLIGEITEDILRFEVRYAYNAREEVLAGDIEEGTGEYEGYYTRGFGVRAVRYNGKWYLTGTGNG